MDQASRARTGLDMSIHEATYIGCEAAAPAASLPPSSPSRWRATSGRRSPDPLEFSSGTPCEARGINGYSRFTPKPNGGATDRSTASGGRDGFAEVVLGLR